MSYPPPEHLLRDLGFTTTHTTTSSVTRLPVTAGLCDDTGVRLGVLATLVDVSGAGIALRAIAPDWIATADLAIHMVRPVTAGSISVESRPLRLGARSVVIDAVLRDDDGALCGTGRMAFARIPGSATKASVAEVSDAAPAAVRMDGGRPLTESIIDACALTAVGPGQIRFDKTPYVENSFGTVNGGVLALSAEFAAVSAAGGGRAQDLQIHYLEQIAAGPVGVTAEVIRDDGATRLCEVRIEDRSSAKTVAVADVLVGEIAD